jgi:hypothetical protein
MWGNKRLRAENWWPKRGKTYVKHAQTTFYVNTTACLLHCTEPALTSGNSSAGLHFIGLITIARLSSLTRLSVRRSPANPQVRLEGKIYTLRPFPTRLIISAHPKVWVHQ